MRLSRFSGNPIIRPHMDERMGANINGPSLIRVPDWVAAPLARYYLYFAHHDGDYIRLAYANDVLGPWRIYQPGVLPLARSHFDGHIASPDVHVDASSGEIRLYYHGSDTASVEWSPQSTRLALSHDGLDFSACPGRLGEAYFRVFRWRNCHYALAMPGLLYRSMDGLGEHEAGPTLFDQRMRHCAVCVKDAMLHVFYTNAGDCPESILYATVNLEGHWSTWCATAPVVVLQPEFEYEGSQLPVVPSLRGMAVERRCELRDPALYQEAGRTWLLYTIAGESGIAVAEISWD